MEEERVEKGEERIIETSLSEPHTRTVSLAQFQNVKMSRLDSDRLVAEHLSSCSWLDLNYLNPSPPVLVLGSDSLQSCTGDEYSLTPSPLTPSPLTPSPLTPSPLTPSPLTPSPLTLVLGSLLHRAL